MTFAKGWWSLSKIDIGEVTHFLQGLKKSNENARKMIEDIQSAVKAYADDTTLKGKAVDSSQRYFDETYTVICKSIIEALDESEERLQQYIHDFGDQVDSSPNARIDAELLQEAMSRLADIKRKQEALMQSLSSSTATLYEGKQQALHTQFTDALEQEKILERYITFEQTHGNFFDSFGELVYRTGQAVRELANNVTFESQTGSYHFDKIDASRFQTLQEMLPKAKKKAFNFNDYQITWNGTTHLLWKNGKVDAEATKAYNEAKLNGKLPKEGNVATQDAELLKGILASLKNKKDPITGADISSVHVLSILSGLAFSYTAGNYKGRKLTVPKSFLDKLKKNRKSKVPKLSSLSEKQQLKLANKYKKKSPIPIPDDAKIKAQTKKAGYEQISYKWKENGITFEVRWHTRTPGAPKEQGNTFVIERKIQGTAEGKTKVQQILVGDNKWVSKSEWQKAITDKKNGVSTSEQNKMLSDGHWKE
ncbi:T7SS effector LXG polymorphic toxin [Listeria seeligeri]|uniref:T7SS effector LXG polymorphic toxin n=1 Tax=Listeria seeligeri TaxID=1640 RepID=UPI001E396621|nr:T7SS effector LXG polymorphic toxin [Listeria seeligeri]